MDRTNVTKKINYINLPYDLVKIGIELVYKVMSLNDCIPELMVSNKHLNCINELSKEWNEKFIDAFVLREGTHHE